MAILFKDTFTDVDGTNLTAHTPDTTTSGLVWKMFSTAVAKVTGSQAYFSAINSYGPAHVELNLQNFAVQVKFVTSISLSVLMLRYVDNSNWLGMVREAETGRITLKKRVAGTFTILWDSGSNQFVAGDTVRAEHEGTTIRVYVNGALKATVTNVTENLGTMQRVGFASPDATPSAARWDDFQIEDLAPAGGTGTPGSISYATKQVINRATSAAYATKQIISLTASTLAATKQTIYQTGSIAYATQQTITDGGIRGAVAYSTKQIISQASSVSIATKQQIYKVSFSQWATQQQIMDFVSIVDTIDILGEYNSIIDLTGEIDFTLDILGELEPLVIELQGVVGMAIENEDKTIYAGNSKDLRDTVKNKDGSAANLSGATVKWVLKRRAQDGNLIEKTSPIGISIAGNVFVVSLTDADTRLSPSRYYYEAKVTDALGKSTTVSTGHIVIKPSGT